MAEDKKKKEQMTCNCGGGMYGCGPYGHPILRMVKAIFIVVFMVIVFMLGVNIGELRGMLQSYDRGMMQRQYYGYNTRMPMMQGAPGMMPGATTTPTAAGSGQ